MIKCKYSIVYKQTNVFRKYRADFEHIQMHTKYINKTNTINTTFFLLRQFIKCDASIPRKYIHVFSKRKHSRFYLVPLGSFLLVLLNHLDNIVLTLKKSEWSFFFLNIILLMKRKPFKNAGL